MKDIKLSPYISKIFETPGKYCEWFGYYNYDTLNYDQTKLLCNRADFDGVEIKKGMKIELGYYDITDGTWHHIGTSDSFNWQQGAMMQWLLGEGNHNKVIYNCSKNGRLISTIHDVVSGESRDLNWPIYGITPDGKKSISLNLERSYWCRAYHYQSVANPKYNVRVAEDDGIFEIDLEKNRIKKIIAIQDVIKLQNDSNSDKQKHWLEHIMISRDGKKIVFLHRYSPEFDTYQYQTIMCLADIDGKNLQVITDEGKFDWSHFGWQGDDGFVMYTVENNKLGSTYKNIGKSTSDKKSLKTIVFSYAVKFKNLLPVSVRQKLKGGKSYYQYYDLQDGLFRLKEKWDQPYFNIDGHPSFTNDGRYMITDSYPDSHNMQRLIVFDTVTKKGMIIGEFNAGLSKNPASCDLHPKLCNDNDYLVIDTAYTGKHRMIVYKIDWSKIKEKLS
ncbi:hypothetical protein [Xylanibacter ruminicola]|uniref:Oligogalacturonide lyase n=1 Tax=Xylanibacter ruminicola TaxID=839 RepID=A0A1M6R7N9_XYLRU|nr:hypothetical protein [Xylanibacter ruminicola]SHK28338.1 hypothetical protein SAMN05216463_101119 [Xylanibacter ruminicola]